MSRRLSLLLLIATTLVVSVAAQELLLDEADRATSWQASGGARVGNRLFLSGDGASASALPIQLPLHGDGARWLTLRVMHTNWTGFVELRVRTFAEDAFETPLDLTIEDAAGHRFILTPPLPFGAPGWHEFRAPLTNSGLNLATIRAISIGLPQPRGVSTPEPRHGSFYVAALTLHRNAGIPAAAVSPVKNAGATQPLRVDLSRVLPQHAPVEKFRIAVSSDTNLIARVPLDLTDEVVFDRIARSNFVRGIGMQAASLQTRTTLLGIAFSITTPRAASSPTLKVAAFQAWLTNTYTTVGDLNGRWNTTLAQFNAVTWPDSTKAAPWRDAISFWQEAVISTLRETIQAARHGAPRAYLLSHLATDAEPLDYYSIQRTPGWSHDSLADGGGDSREFVSGGFVRAAVSTLAAQMGRRLWADSFDWAAPEGAWLRGRAERWLAPVASRNLWLQLAAGKDGVTVHEPVSQLDAPLRQTAPLWPVFANTRRASPRVAVIWSASSKLLNFSAGREERWFYDNFWAAGYEPAVIFEEMLRDYPKAWTDYNVLALGGATHLPNWLQDGLLSWINSGGTLLCSGLPGLFDPWGRRLARVTWETLGLDNAAFTPPQLKPGCEVIATGDDGHPLALRAKYGRGEIVVSLAPWRDVKLLRDYLPWKLRERVKRDIESDNRNLYLDWRTTDNSRAFFAVAINLSPYVAAQARVTANGVFSRIVNLCDDGGARPLPLEVADEATTFPLSLPPGGGAVLMLEKASHRRR